ncbi:MAG: glycoside hydrolase N-terminal domain-containing protein [Bryobacteraceae bacterium]
MRAIPCLLISTVALSAGEPVIRFQRPAAEWNEALPIANGRIGAMVIGGASAERLQLNDDRVWAGDRIDRLNPNAARALPEVRRLLWAGKVSEAEELADRDIISKPRRMPPYQPLGDLHIYFPRHDQVANYERQLDLSTAVHTVKYRTFDSTHTREVFASYPAQLIAIRITSERLGGPTAPVKRTNPDPARGSAPKPASFASEAPCALPAMNLSLKAPTKRPSTSLPATLSRGRISTS